ncbi:unnamed protein product [Trichobilharzia regenti]|nr:unnamed protein product [Trichobilharzia regenti]
MSRSIITPAFPVSSLTDSSYDAVLLVNDDAEHLPEPLKLALNALEKFSEIFSPTGQLNTDEADIRNVYDAAVDGMKK